MNTDNYQKISQFYQEYAAAVDAADWDGWLSMFTDDCLYKVQSRENYDRKLPMAALSLDSKNMLKDRIYGITETIFHDPYLQTHIISAPRLTGVSPDVIESEANYAVFRTKNDGIAQVFNVGRYIDRLVIVEDKVLIKSRVCVFDNDMILNSLIYPI